VTGHRSLRVSALLCSLGMIPALAVAQGRPTALAVTRANAADLRAMDAQVDRMIRTGELRVRETMRDSMLPDRSHERLDQYVRGVRILGGDLTRQSGADGTISIFGMLHDGVAIDTNPGLTPVQAQQAIGRAVSGQPFDAPPELVVLPLSDGYHLAYVGRALVDIKPMTVMIDATTGGLLRQQSDFISEIGTGKGAYGDDKKISDVSSAGAFIADDKLRPTEITTYDMKGNLSRMTALFSQAQTPAAADVASSATNTWSDSTVVDAHVYAGWYYDYLFKRFGRHGIDDRDLRIALFTHPVSLADIQSAPPSVVGTYYINAAYCGSCGPNGRGAVEFGEGAPRGFFAPGVEVKPFSAAFDVVAHELTHAVTGNTARLNGYQFSEGGALNEAFSDIFGVSTAFFHETPGNSPLQASYLQGRDLTVPAASGLARSMANPRSTGDPDHYSQRILGFDPHYNSTIISHAFYLAIEGGTNRTSGQTVRGVGATNREQIEKSFFRALTVLMPSSSTFALTRAATIQAAHDLYGAGGSVDQAITQAWDAVGVQLRTDPTAAMLPNPDPVYAGACTGLATPHWLAGITVSAGASNLRISQWALDFYNHTGALDNRVSLTSTNFAQFFSQCGPGSSLVQAQSDACTTICLDLGGDRNGSAQLTFTATDDAGRSLTFTTQRVTLLPPQ
jgi:Zn-dependent metalloprotease